MLKRDPSEELNEAGEIVPSTEYVKIAETKKTIIPVMGEAPTIIEKTVIVEKPVIKYVDKIIIKEVIKETPKKTIWSKLTGLFK